MRNVFRGIIILLLTCLPILPCPKDVGGAEWIRYATGGGVLRLYDAESINYLPNNSVRVFVKMIPEDEEIRLKMIADFRKIDPTLDNFRQLRSLYEINCKDRTYKSVQIIFYNKEERAIGKLTDEEASVTYISPESTEELLYEKMCVKKDTTKKRQCEGVLCW
ncbi:MAG: surface-adhesin E family protein [Syntrophales bacterium]